MCISLVYIVYLETPLKLRIGFEFGKQLFGNVNAEDEVPLWTTFISIWRRVGDVQGRRETYC
jgi:hypothetical protein